MTAQELRANARKALTGKWGTAAVLTLVFFLINFAISFILRFIPFLGPLVSLVISPVLSFGILIAMMKLKRGEEVGYTEFFNLGFGNFARVWAVVGWTILKMIIPIICYILAMFLIGLGIGMNVSSAIGATSSSASKIGGPLYLVGIIACVVVAIWIVCKGYYYRLANFIIWDNPDIDAKSAVEQSEELMKGHRWQLFWLQLTFIGWSILASFTCGIGLLWLIPYMQIAEIEFYENLAGINQNSTQEPENVEPITTTEA